MKKILLLACLSFSALASVTASAQDYAPAPSQAPPIVYDGAPPPGYYPPPGRFQQHRFDELRRLDAQIAQLQGQRQCIYMAANPGMMHACYAPPPVVVAAPPRHDNVILGVKIH